MNSENDDILKDMVCELRQCIFREQYEDLFYKPLTFIQANGVPPKHFVMPCKWSYRSNVHGSSKTIRSGSRFQRGGGSLHTSDDGSSSDGDDVSRQPPPPPPPPPPGGSHSSKDGSDSDNQKKVYSCGYLCLLNYSNHHKGSPRYGRGRVSTFHQPALSLPSFSGRDQSFESGWEQMTEDFTTLGY